MQEIDMGGDIVVINGKPFSKTKLTIEWFGMSNDMFFRVYGFNFNPHKYPGLYEAGRRIMERNWQQEQQKERIGGPIWNSFSR